MRDDLLHRPGQNVKDEPDVLLKVHVAKNRLGRTGKSDLRFLPETAQITDPHDGQQVAPF